jgi:hypothetical protein
MCSCALFMRTAASPPTKVVRTTSRESLLSCDPATLPAQRFPNPLAWTGLDAVRDLATCLFIAVHALTYGSCFLSLYLRGFSDQVTFFVRFKFRNAYLSSGTTISSICVCLNVCAHIQMDLSSERLRRRGRGKRHTQNWIRQWC